MSQQPFGDIPLFREIQKLLASSEGPINFELARQVALAAATQGRSDSQPDAATKRLYSEGVHAAEEVLSGYTRLDISEPAKVETVGPAWWVTSTLGAWRWLLEHVGEHFTKEMARLGQQSEGANPMTSAMGQVTPLLMGAQAGTLIGQLAGEALERYDFPIPRDDDPLLFVVDNINSLARDYSFKHEDFARWLALSSVAHHLVVTSVSWVDRYLRSLLMAVIDAVEIDLADMERRLTELQGQGMESLEQSGIESALPIVQSERHHKALERLRTFVAVLQGYASHATDAVATQLIPEASKIQEGMARRTASPSEGKTMLSSLFGISLDRQPAVSGSTFCAAIAKLKGMGALNQVWAAPDNLPTAEEIKDPFAWMERVLGEQ
jgi:putative hydrolase